jgi:hypothetical protein
MTLSRQPVSKVTISLPADLLAFADTQARRLNASRSEFISQLLQQMRAAATERLAAEGYHFYAGEACDFADASGAAVAEALGNEH